MKDTVTIDGLVYERRSEPSAIRIVVLHRGWVVVGRYSCDGDEVVVSSASVIRVWGTTKGLGEIASGGPTPTTELDPCGVVRVHRLAVVMTLDCEVSKWTQKVS